MCILLVPSFSSDIIIPMTPKEELQLACLREEKSIDASFGRESLNLIVESVHVNRPILQPHFLVFPIPQCMLHPFSILSFLHPHSLLSSLQYILMYEEKKGNQTVKSSRACAPLLSFRASAECIVMDAFINRFSSSIVSIKSEFLHSPQEFYHIVYLHLIINNIDLIIKYRRLLFYHIKLRSLTWTSSKLSHALSIN